MSEMHLSQDLHEAVINIQPLSVRGARNCVLAGGLCHTHIQADWASIAYPLGHAKYRASTLYLAVKEVGDAGCTHGAVV